MQNFSFFSVAALQVKFNLRYSIANRSTADSGLTDKKAFRNMTILNQVN